MATQIGNALNSLSEPSQNFLVQAENDQILDFHAALETFSHDASLNDSLHGLTSTGEAIGLGKVGDANPITDIAQAPGDTANGESPLTQVTDLVNDTGLVVNGAENMVTGLQSDLSNPDVATSVINSAPEFPGILLNGENLDDAAGVVDGAPDLIGNPTGLGNAGLGDTGLGDVGLGDVGGLANGGLGDTGLGDTALGAAGLGNIGNLGDLANGLTGTNGSGDALVSLGAGDSGGAPILNAGVLHAAPAESPIDVAAGSGENLLDLGALSGDGGNAGRSGESLVSLGAGDHGSPSILDAAALGGSNGDSPIDAAVGSGQNLAGIDALGGDTGTGNGSGDSLVTVGAGDHGSPSILDAAALGGSNGDSPIDVAAVSGQNLVDVDALTGNTGMAGGSGDSLVTAGAGNDGSPSVLSAAALGGTNGGSPIDVAAGAGENLADINALNDDGSGHLVSGDAGAAGGNPVLDAGVLTTPDAQSPVNADVANGTNIVNASLLSHSDALQFPDLGGAGTDALTGIVPAAPGAIDPGAVTDTGSGTTPDQSLIDIHTDGSALLQTHGDPNSLVGVNDHALV